MLLLRSHHMMHIFYVTGTDLSFEPVQIIAHTVPSGLQAVNGSDDDGDCGDVNTQSSGLRVCEDPNGISISNANPTKSVLVDGTTPTLDFSDNNWAEGFFTVSRNDGTTIELGFELDINDNIAQVEVESLECPDRGIGTSSISLFGMEDPGGFLFPSFDSGTTILSDTVTPEATSCSVQNHTLYIPMGEQPYRYYYLMFTFSNSDIDWLFLAEVRFLINSSIPTTTSTAVTPPTTTVTPAPSAILLTGIAVSTPLPPSSALDSSTTPTTILESSPSVEPSGDNKDDDQTIVFVVVIIVIILAIVLVIVTIVILIVLIKVRRRHQKSQVEKLQSAMLEHETVELTSLKITTSQKESTDGTLTYKAPPTSNGRPDSIANPTYETPSDLKQPQTEGTVPSTEYSEINDSTTLPGYPYQDPDGDLGLPGYSTIPENGNGGELVTDTYAAVREITPQPKPVETLDVYAEVKSNDRPHEAPTVEELYTAVQKDPKPFIPEKSVELVEYLDTKSYMHDALSSNGEPRGKSPSRQIPTYQPPKLATISKPVCDDMLTNLAYQSVEVDNVDNIYAEPSAQGEDSEQGIYETVYSEPIKPSLFTHDLSDSTEWQEDLQPYAPIYTVPIAPPKEEEKPLEVTDDNIREVRQLGTGAFGQVVLATTVGLSLKDLKMSSTDDDKTKSVLVAVKMLKPSASSGMLEIFQKEQKFMGRLKHENVIRLLGVCTTDTPFLMMEYMENGDLNQYLQKYKEVIPDGEVIGEDQIATSTLIDMAAQIASAMNYLASHNFVHRDLATRNCLVGQNNIIKIADFGMSRKLYDSHYYRIHGRAILPIRWMATECFYGKFSQKTDVWAFGVVMWEIFVLAKIQPYDGVQDQDIIQEAIKGKGRLLPDKPDACPDDVYRIMCECWEFEPSDRASFEELYTMLSSFNSQ